MLGSFFKLERKKPATDAEENEVEPDLKKLKLSVGNRHKPAPFNQNFLSRKGPTALTVFNTFEQINLGCTVETPMWMLLNRTYTGNRP